MRGVQGWMFLIIGIYQDCFHIIVTFAKQGAMTGEISGSPLARG